MEYLTFVAYLSKAKRSFIKKRYEHDCHYRSVLFHQFGESYRRYCKTNGIADEYDQLFFDVLQYEQRIQQYRECLK